MKKVHRFDSCFNKVAMSLSHTIFNTFFKRNSVMVGTVFATTFVFQVGFDEGINKWWDARNKGKLWKDVKLTLGEGGEEDEDDDE